MENNIIILGTLFYFFGSIPFAYLLPKITGFGDIRNIGSGNVGATNVLRTGNKTLAIIVLILDILKGFLPLFILKDYFITTISENYIFFISSFTIIGHLFPIWLKFKGGKGVATYIGYLFAINFYLGLIFIFLWIIVAIIKRYSSLASIVSIFFLPIAALILKFEYSIIFLLVLIGSILIMKHYSNILRLFNNTENKIRF